MEVSQRAYDGAWLAWRPARRRGVTMQWEIVAVETTREDAEAVTSKRRRK